MVSYPLQQLTRDDYLLLSEHERLFVHSYWGRRWLYPPPARFVNHSDDPNTWQDFDRQCNIASRPIATGELVTTDAHKETEHELKTFLLAYQDAVSKRDVESLESLFDDAAFGWVEPHGHVERQQLIEEATSRAAAAGVTMTISDPKWLIGTGRWEAVCSYDCPPQPVGSSSPVRTRHATDVLRVIDGNWQFVYRHESP